MKTPIEVIIRDLKRHQRWRSGDDEDEMLPPSVLSERIDQAIAILATQQCTAKTSEKMKKRKP